jgi:hypothetical protein
MDLVALPGGLVALAAVVLLSGLASAVVAMLAMPRLEAAVPHGDCLELELRFPLGGSSSVP